MLWFATWLGISYCLKIVNFNHPRFICIKERFPKIVPGLLIGSVLVSLAIRISRAFHIQAENATNQASNNSENASSMFSSNGTRNEWLSGNGPSTIVMIEMLVASVAFVMFSFSSLCGHMRQMAQNADSFQNPNLKAHLGAQKKVAMLLVIYLIFYVAYVLINLETDINIDFGCFSIKRLSFVFPSLSSLILILGNPNLKKTLVKIFFQSFCFKQDV
ncbi:taste receptor type 2 member 40-like [Ambystoma mexicanum]|uniref:taste receptor type 2 member 40-like n=1 Tax=Ambystoma mexicanum TaxID=8296 RepID=UPI0037E8C48D